VTQINITENKKPKNSFKIIILTVASAFLLYSIYWLVSGIIWGYTVTYMLLHVSQISILNSMGIAELTALFIQEWCSVTNSFVLLFCGIFAFQSAILYIRNNSNFLRKLRLALILLAIFSLLLVPASVHHLLGIAFSWSMVDIYVGLSYLLQALLIVPPLLILSQKMKNPQNTAQIIRWVAIAAPLITFALWCKYLLLWVDTLVPLGTKESTLATTVGAANSIVTLLVAGVVMTSGCYAIVKSKPLGKKLAAATILIGSYFSIYTIVALFVPVYASFWYLTDTWMLTLPIIGIYLLTKRNFLP
jgi:hypothetical protein